MSMLKKSGIAWAAVLVAVLALAAGGVLLAQASKPHVGPSRGHVFNGVVPKNLPKVPRGGMNITPNGADNLSVLSFDDGTCESGLGAGVTVSSLVEFDVPTQCVQSGLQVVQMTARMNTFNAQAAVLHQAGATPNPATQGPDVSRSINLAGLGACPATQLDTVTFTPMTVTATSNFFAGLLNTGWAGRDTNGALAGRIWLNCAACGDTQYSPSDLSGIGLGGNWMIRVTVEDAACVPVELMGFTVD